MPSFSFGLIADCQYADAPDTVTASMQRYYTDSPRRLAEAISELNAHDLAFVAHLGDLIDIDLENADTVLDILAGSHAPVHLVLGNHDFAGPDGSVNDLADVLARYGLGAAYYSFTHDDWRFCVLDSNAVGIIEHRPGTPGFAAGSALLAELEAEGAGNAKSWNGTIDDAQRAWLMAQLDEAAAAGQRVAVMCHHPLDDSVVDGMLRGDALADELDAHPASAVVFTGHHHAGGFRQAGDLPCLTLHGMVETTVSAFAIVDVYADRLQVRGFGREPDRTLVLRRDASAA
jgi:3',5'-cyclic AMP phosphodiesterase CpdA